MGATGGQLRRPRVAFILIRLRHSYCGREDHNLEEKLSAGLLSILNWALIGLDRLSARGHFVQPQASREMLEEFEQLPSPITKFIEDELVLDADGEAPKQAIFERYKVWATANGYERHSPLSDFCRDLLAALPTFETSRPRTTQTPAGAPDHVRDNFLPTGPLILFPDAFATGACMMLTWSTVRGGSCLLTTGAISTAADAARIAGGRCGGNNTAPSLHQDSDEAASRNVRPRVL